MPEFMSTVDLSNCDREPIHIPGSIQPHGILLVVEPGTFRIIQVAGDTENILGRKISAILDRTIADVVGAYPASLLDQGRGTPEPGYLGSFVAPGQRPPAPGSHRSLSGRHPRLGDRTKFVPRSNRGGSSERGARNSRGIRTSSRFAATTSKRKP